MGLRLQSLYLAEAMTLGKVWLYCLGLLALFLGCSTDNKTQNFSYLRSPAYFKADTTNTIHPFCSENAIGFSSKEECAKTKKYRLSWLRPEDTTNFRGYRIYVDTVPPNAGNFKDWKTVSSKSNLASIIIDRISAQDSLIFIFAASNASPEFVQDTLGKDTRKIFIIDTSFRQESETGRLVFALVPVYAGDVTPGQPQLSWFIVNDKFSPDIFSTSIKPMDHALSIDWARPNDPTSFFDATLDTGFIKNYWFKVTLDGRLYTERKQNFKPKIQFFRGGVDLSNSVRDSAIFDVKDSLAKGHAYYLPDSGRAHKKEPNLTDSLRLILSNLSPEDTLNIQLWAVDSAGNQNENTMQNVTIHLTDTTQPSIPRLSVDSAKTTSNSFIINWTASMDSLGNAEDGKKYPGTEPNFRIEEYRLSRILVRDSGETGSLLDKLDTVINIAGTTVSTSVFVDTMRFLPPGRTFKLSITALDITGFESQPDTLTVQTPPIRFTSADSGLICPPGFIPIPRGRFALGQAEAGAQQDESKVKEVTMGPYCIEPYEHRNTNGDFVTNVSWDQADSICKALDPDSLFETQLCSEVEWERACEGPGIGPDSALVHGIQSEQKNQSILQSTCNQGTNDSVMARSFDLRSAACLTREGVYDLAGNYSEWVRDPYYDSAYYYLPTGDSLDHGYILPGPKSPDTVRGFRGGNFLKPGNLAVSTIQSLARCSNRDFAQQIRPVFRKDCEDTVPKIAVIYGSGPANHFCMPIHPKLVDRKITGFLPKDSINFVVFEEGNKDPIYDSILETDYPPGDTLFKLRRPSLIKLTTRSLAVVHFVKPGVSAEITDTLDATEMRDTSQAALAKIFTREAANSGWTVKKENGKYSIRYLYGYTTLGTKPAKANYSNRAIGFRCCSRAIPPP